MSADLPTRADYRPPVRTLPVRVPPLPGEPLDSWLEALSARTDTPFGQTLRHLGFPSRTQQYRGDDGPPPDWTILLHNDEAHRLAYATGLTPDAVTATTLARYAPHAVHLDPQRRTVHRHVLWGRGSGSRYCPDCLGERGGRWRLFWRLGWAFACTRHRRLLADSCPHCDRIPRSRPHSGRSVPQPGTCGNAPVRPSSPHTRGCGSRLEDTPTLRLPEHHPALQAQQHLEDIITNPGVLAFGAYAHSPQPTRRVLTDIRAVAQRVLAHLPDDHLPEYVPDDLLATHRAAPAPTPAGRLRPGFPDRGEPDRRTGFMAPTRAAATALAVVAALRAFADPDIRAGGALLRALHQAHRPQVTTPVIPSTLRTWGLGLSPVLEAVHLAALAPGLRPSGQLRHRTASPLPRQPTADERPLHRRARQTPAGFWPAWSARLLPPALADAPDAAPALAVALLMVGNPQPLQAAAERLGASITGYQASLVLRRLHKDPHWHHIATALTVLADHLDTHPDAPVAPVDYTRRRRLDYNRLLPREQWTTISEHAQVPDPAGRHTNAIRRCLIQRLGGTAICPARDADVLARLTTPGLAAALDTAAHDFLYSHGIHDEPVSWTPSEHLLHDLDLPGPDLAGIDIPRLHQLLRRRGTSVRQAADTLGISHPAAHHLVDTHPIYPVPPPAPKPQRAPRPPLEILAPALTSRYALQRLERFAVAVTHRTFSDAAEALGATYPALHKQIQILSTDFGGPLLIRATRSGPMRPTRLGRHVADAVTRTTREEMTRFLRQNSTDHA